MRQEVEPVSTVVVSFAAVIRVVTQRFSPLILARTPQEYVREAVIG